MISIVWGLILLIIVVLLTIIGFVYKTKSSDYKELEVQLVEASKKYVDQYFLYPEDSSVKIKLQEMQEENFIGELKKDNDVCDGYVIVSKKGLSFEYQGYVKCPKFETKGY